MHTFQIGDKVRCKKRGCEHDVTATSDGPFGHRVMLTDCWDWADASMVEPAEPIAPPYSIPAAAHEAPAEARECSCCNNKVWPNAFVCCDCYADGCRTYVSYPDTARRILDMGRTQQAAPVPQQPVDERAAGVARAVKNLSNHEKRLGASRFQP
jgi:hypothetical protein